VVFLATVHSFQRATDRFGGAFLLALGLMVVIAHGGRAARPDQATAKDPPMRSRMASSAA
jgi:hypothetical protein